MARRHKPFWDRWFELVPGHEKIGAFYKEPIDPARPRYELARALGLFGAGCLFVAVAVVLRQNDGALVAVGVYFILAGTWPLGKLAEYGAGKFVWVIAAAGTVLHFIDSPTFAMLGFQPAEWIWALNIAIGTGLLAGLLAGIWKLTSAAFQRPPLYANAASLEDLPRERE